MSPTADLADAPRADVGTSARGLPDRVAHRLAGFLTRSDRHQRVGVMGRLGLTMVGLGLLCGLVFPVFLEEMAIATPSEAWSVPSRVACLVAGLLVGGLNYVLANLVVGSRLGSMSRQMHRVDEIVRAATRAGDWSELSVASCRLPVTSRDEFGEAALAFNTLVSALDDNVAERRRLEAALYHQAFHDPLTGLANRALFVDRSEHALERAKRDGTRLAVLFVDLDGFKSVNDTLGHAAGDVVLVETARRLTAGRRCTDTVARIGGDEFAVLLEGADADAAECLADELCGRLCQPVPVGDGTAHIGASIGTAVGGDRTDTLEALLRMADRAMYRAKSSGAGCVRDVPVDGLTTT